MTMNYFKSSIPYIIIAVLLNLGLRWVYQQWYNKITYTTGNRAADTLWQDWNLTTLADGNSAWHDIATLALGDRDILSQTWAFSDNTSISKMFAKISTLYRQGLYAAVSVATKQVNTRDSQLQSMMLAIDALSHCQRKLHEECLELAQEAVATDPSVPLTYIIAARAYRTVEDNGTAMQLYDVAASLGARFAPSDLLTRGMTNFYRRNYTQAHDLFTQYLWTTTGDVTGLTFLARNSYDQYYLDNAITTLDQILEIEPTSVGYYLRKGRVYDRLGDTDSALQMYNQGLLLHPRHVELLRDRVRLAYQLWDSDAVQQYGYLIQQYAGTSIFNLTLAVRASALMDDMRQGETYLQRAKDIADAIEDPRRIKREQNRVHELAKSYYTLWAYRSIIDKQDVTRPRQQLADQFKQDKIVRFIDAFASMYSEQNSSIVVSNFAKILPGYDREDMSAMITRWRLHTDTWLSQQILNTLITPNNKHYPVVIAAYHLKNNDLIAAQPFIDKLINDQTIEQAPDDIQWVAQRYLRQLWPQFDRYDMMRPALSLY
jgi:tetratricopeptide (TPR) repeat protein